VKVPEFRRQRGLRRASSPSAAGLGVVRVDPDFTEEYPGGDPSAAEVVATLIRAGQTLYDEIDRAMQASIGVPESVLNTLAVIDGSAEALTPSEISERTYRSSATMTSILDTLEHCGWVRRVPNPEDRRSVLVEITDEGKAVADRFLPGIRKIEKVILADLSTSERAMLMELLAKVLLAAAKVRSAEPIPLEGHRNRPARLR
jgi:DNA-binding MarR family transcriptional regulator